MWLQKWVEFEVLVWWKLPPDRTQAAEILNTDSPHFFHKTNKKKLAEE